MQKFAPYNFKNFHAFKIERILQKTALVREVAAVGEAVPSLTDAGGYLFNGKWKIIFEKVNNTLSPAPPPREGMKKYPREGMRL